MQNLLNDFLCGWVRCCHGCLLRIFCVGPMLVFEDFGQYFFVYHLDVHDRRRSDGIPGPIYVRAYVHVCCLQSSNFCPGRGVTSLWNDLNCKSRVALRPTDRQATNSTSLMYTIWRITGYYFFDHQRDHLAEWCIANCMPLLNATWFMTS